MRILGRGMGSGNDGGDRDNVVDAKHKFQARREEKGMRDEIVRRGADTLRKISDLFLWKHNLEIAGKQNTITAVVAELIRDLGPFQVKLGGYGLSIETPDTFDSLSEAELVDIENAVKGANQIFEKLGKYNIIVRPS